MATPRFLQVPWALVAIPEIGWNERAIYSRIAELQRVGRKEFTQEYLASGLLLSRSSMARGIKLLVKLGLLVSIRRKKPLSNSYIVVDLASWAKPRAKNAAPKPAKPTIITSMDNVAQIQADFRRLRERFYPDSPKSLEKLSEKQEVKLHQMLEGDNLGRWKRRLVRMVVGWDKFKENMNGRLTDVFPSLSLLTSTFANSIPEIGCGSNEIPFEGEEDAERLKEALALVGLDPATYDEVERERER